MKVIWYRLFICVLMIVMISACGAPNGTTTGASNEHGISIEDAWARSVSVGTDQATSETETPNSHGNHDGSADDGEHAEPSSGVTSAVYLTIVNRGTADELTGVTSDVAEAVELHTVTIEDNVARMRPVPAVEVPADATVEFRTGGYHIMLVNVTRSLEPGDTVNLTLTFRNAGDVAVRADVREP